MRQVSLHETQAAVHSGLLTRFHDPLPDIDEVFED